MSSKDKSNEMEVAATPPQCDSGCCGKKETIDESEDEVEDACCGKNDSCCGIPETTPQCDSGCCGKEETIDESEDEVEDACCGKNDRCCGIPATPPQCDSGCCGKKETIDESEDEVEDGKTNSVLKDCCSKSNASENINTKDCCSKMDNCCVGESCCCDNDDECCKVALHLQKKYDFGGKRKAGGSIVRSIFISACLYCSFQIPVLDEALTGVPGVRRHIVNRPLQRLYIEHDPAIISAEKIKGLLDENFIKTFVKRDGHAFVLQRRGSNRVKRSKFFVEKICCASEIPAIKTILVPLDGVHDIQVNVTTKTVYVDHETDRIEAQKICNALNAEAFGASIEYDAGSHLGRASSFAASVVLLQYPHTQNSLDRTSLNQFLSTYAQSMVENFAVDKEMKRITVVHNPLLLPAENIAKRVSETFGVNATIEKDGKDAFSWEFEGAEADEVLEDDPPIGLRPTVAISGLLWVISMLSFIGGSWEWLKYVALPSVAFGLPPIAMKAARSLRRFQFDANCLMAFASIGALALQEFTEAAAVTFLFAISEWLEFRATARARKALSAIVQLRPSTANLIHPETGEVVVVAAGAVPVGALVSVKSGDKIPCDGVVMEGNSMVDESSLTGESRPVQKGPKDIVSGGTINSGNTQMTIRTMASAEDSAVARLIRLVEEAQANRSDTEKLVDEFARIYTPLILFPALAMCSIPWIWGRDIGSEWAELGLVLIVVACPCALIISTPVSYVAGITALAQHGVLVKGGAFLEALGLVKKVCFDKTGTLTKGVFQLLDFRIVGSNKSRKEVLEYLALIEERASHPLAQSLLQGVRNEGIRMPKGVFVNDHTFLPGEGVSGSINGEVVYVGNVRLFQRLNLFGTLLESEQKEIKKWEKLGTVGLMSIGDIGIVAYYCVSDGVRAESAEVLMKLKEMNIESIMLTGDNHSTALSIGKLIGMKEEHINSRLLPEEKLSIIEDMKDGCNGGRSILANLCSSRKLVMMVGDGVNDAPALATADVGAAMGEGAALAMETVDVTVLDSNLSKLVSSIKMGQSVIRKIKENVIFSLATKFLVLGFALAGKAALWAAIASDVGAMILVTLNSMMLLPSSRSRNELVEVHV